MFGHALYIYMMAQLAPQPLYAGPWTLSAVAIKPTTNPVAVVTLVPYGDDWLLVAGNSTWAAPAILDCKKTPPLKVIVHREERPDLVFSLDCKKETE